MTEIVLVGGGHAHVIVLRAFADRPEPGVRLTMVTRDLRTPYSGMLPGHVAGFYDRDEIHIDLVRLTEAAGARLVVAEAVGFERAARRVLLRGHAPLPYDILSIDIGVEPDLSGVEGAKEHALAVKPIGDFLEKWDRLRDHALTAEGPRHIAVVGGGAAGICLAFAVSAALRRDAGSAGVDPREFVFTLVSSEPPRELNAGVQRRVRRALAERKIEIVAGDAAAAITPGALTLASGRPLPVDAALFSTQAAPPAALSGLGVERDQRGFLAIRPTLVTLGDDRIFAAGDCATMVDHPRPKAGLFAVRQGPVLARNLRRRARGQPLREHIPQKDWLVLIGTGDGRAIGGRGRRLAIEGAWVWRLKDWIDRRFMRRFRLSHEGGKSPPRT